VILHKASDRHEKHEKAHKGPIERVSFSILDDATLPSLFLFVFFVAE
jgi:hypothetical protein